MAGNVDVGHIDCAFGGRERRGRMEGVPLSSVGLEQPHAGGLQQENNSPSKIQDSSMSV